MNVNCTNSKNYALTVGTEYEVLEHANRRYTVINDRGVQKRYGDNLFEEVPDVPLITIDTILDSMSVSRTAAGNAVNTTFLLGEDEKSLPNLGIRGSGDTFSCGVKLITGINGFLANLNDDDAGLGEFNTPENRLRFMEEFMIKLNEIMQEAGNTGLYLISTNVKSEGEGEENYQEFASMNEASDSFTDSLNPNSGNIIRVWVFATDLEPLEDDGDDEDEDEDDE